MYPRTKKSSTPETVCASAAPLVSVQHLQKGALNSVSNIFSGFLKNNTIHPETVDSFVDDVISQTSSKNAPIKYFIRSENPCHFQVVHAINVLFYSLYIGRMLGFNENKLKSLGKGALLHNIGMLEIEPSILYKRQSLTYDERFQIERHTVYGYDILRKISGFPDEVSIAAYQHHERNNGDGYPRNLHSRWIHINSKIVAISDVFCSLISPRVYRPVFSLFDGIQLIIDRELNRLDPDILKKFLSSLGFPLPGSIVTLSNGIKAKIINLNISNPQKSTVEIVSDNRHILVDLSKSSDVKIQKISSN